MRRSIRQLTLLLMLLLPVVGGPVAGTLRVLLAPPSQTAPINEEEEQKGKEQASRSEATARRSSPHTYPVAYAGRSSSKHAIAAAECSRSAQMRGNVSAGNLRNGLGAPLLC